MQLGVSFFMGCDGGSIPKRIDLIKKKQKQTKPDAAEQRKSLWMLCQLSKEPLKQPIVSDVLGKLYNKDAILEYLLNESNNGDADVICQHIKSLKNIVTLKVTPNPLVKGASSALLYNSTQEQLAFPFICPVSQKEMNGLVRFCYLPCGCVFSEQALKQVSCSDCLVCGKPFDNEKIILLNPSSTEEIQIAQNRLKKRRASDDEKSKKKKRKPQEASINMDMPNLDSLNAATIPASAAIGSLYAKKDKDGKVIDKEANWLSKSNFNRYAAC